MKKVVLIISGFVLFVSTIAIVVVLLVRPWTSSKSDIRTEISALITTPTPRLTSTPEATQSVRQNTNASIDSGLVSVDDANAIDIDTDIPDFAEGDLQ